MALTKTVLLMLMPTRTMCVTILKTTQGLMRAGGSSFAGAVAAMAVVWAIGSVVVMGNAAEAVDGVHNFLITG
jgi:hypothetical protein